MVRSHCERLGCADDDDAVTEIERAEELCVIGKKSYSEAMFIRAIKASLTKDKDKIAEAKGLARSQYAKLLKKEYRGVKPMIKAQVPNLLIAVNDLRGEDSEEEDQDNAADAQAAAPGLIPEAELSLAVVAST